MTALDDIYKMNKRRFWKPASAVAAKLHKSKIKCLVVKKTR